VLSSSRSVDAKTADKYMKTKLPEQHKKVRIYTQNYPELTWSCLTLNWKRYLMAYNQE
jgi:hypothetical protein